jgi:hypothetical protein
MNPDGRPAKRGKPAAAMPLPSGAWQVMQGKAAGLEPPFCMMASPSGAAWQTNALTSKAAPMGHVRRLMFKAGWKVKGYMVALT